MPYIVFRRKSVETGERLTLTFAFTYAPPPERIWWTHKWTKKIMGQEMVVTTFPWFHTASWYHHTRFFAVVLIERPLEVKVRYRIRFGIYMYVKKQSVSICWHKLWLCVPLTELKHNWAVDIPLDPRLPEPDELLLWQIQQTLWSVSAHQSYMEPEQAFRVKAPQWSLFQVRKPSK